MPTSTEIVNEMIERLRALKVDGQYPPVGRRINAGRGLTGGGDLTADVMLQVSDEVMRAVGEVKALTGRETASPADVKRAITVAVDRLHPPTTVRDFTVTDSPTERVTAPPVRVNRACTIARVDVVVASPASRPVAAIVAGRRVTVAAGAEHARITPGVAVPAGGSIQVMVEATDAARIVVSVWCEETAP